MIGGCLRVAVCGLYVPESGGGEFANEPVGGDPHPAPRVVPAAAAGAGGTVVGLRRGTVRAWTRRWHGSSGCGSMVSVRRGLHLGHGLACISGDEISR